MDLVELTEYLVKNLVKDQESVKVTLDESDVKVITVKVSSDDIGAVIGRGGKIANSIRNIVQASAYINNLGHVRVNIDTE